MSNDLKAVYAEDSATTTHMVAEMMAAQGAIWSGPCAHCGAQIGPDTTGRPMCYGCGPVDMIPAGVLSDVERHERRWREHETKRGLL